MKKKSISFDNSKISSLTKHSAWVDTWYWYFTKWHVIDKLKRALVDWNISFRGRILVLIGDDVERLHSTKCTPWAFIVTTLHWILTRPIGWMYKERDSTRIFSIRPSGLSSFILNLCLYFSNGQVFYHCSCVITYLIFWTYVCKQTSILRQWTELINAHLWNQ